MQKPLIIFIALFVSLTSLAQVNLDSLWNVWQDDSKDDSLRYKAIYKLAWDGFLKTDPDSALKISKLHFDFAEAHNNTKQMANALNVQGSAYWYKLEYEKALEKYKFSLKIREENNDKKAILGSLYNIASILNESKEYEKSIEYFDKAILISEEIGDKNNLQMNMHSLGLCYDRLGIYSKAIEFYHKSLKIKKELNDKRGEAILLKLIGDLHKKHYSYEKALEYYFKALSINKNLDYKSEVSVLLTKIGIIYNYQDSLDLAIDYYQKSMDIQEELGDKHGISLSLNNIGFVYYGRKEYKKAMEYYKRSLKIQQDLGKTGALTLNNIGLVHYEMGEYVDAIKIETKALEYAQKDDNMYIIKDAAFSLYRSYNVVKNYHNALKMHELYHKVRDSINTKEAKSEFLLYDQKMKYEKHADSLKTEQLNKEALEIAEQNRKDDINQKESEKKNMFIWACLIGLIFVMIFAFFFYNRFRLTKKQKEIIESQKQKVESQKYVLEEKNKEILDSIEYAKHLQTAIFPSKNIINELFSSLFIVYAPKSIVAGDFYWMEKCDGKIYFAVADCTGHGVPGAIISVICNNGLNRSLRESEIKSPGKILDKTREIVIQEFEKSDDEVKDGMDIALCSINGNLLEYAGANNPLWLIRDKKLIEFKADRQPIGEYSDIQPFTTQSIDLKKDDTIYIFSDGFVDQFGGEKGKKYKKANFKKLLLSIQDKSMDQQKEILNNVFNSWKADLEQIDDVCVMGVRV